LLSPGYLGRFSTAASALLLLAVHCHAQASKTEATPPASGQAASGSSSAAKAAAHQTTSKHRKSHKTAKNWRKRGQQKIDSQRAQEIQEALIREHYLTGAPSGVWDDSTQKAMQHYQADNGWQDKSTPDSRALIKLGLGPDREHLLNPESAMTASPQPAAAKSAPPSKKTSPAIGAGSAVAAPSTAPASEPSAVPSAADPAPASQTQK